MLQKIVLKLHNLGHLIVMGLLQLAGRGRGSASQRVSSRFSSRSCMYPSCEGWQLYITPSDYLHDWVLHFLEVVVLFILTSKCACVNALLRQRYDLLRFIIAFVFSFPPLRYLVAYILQYYAEMPDQGEQGAIAPPPPQFLANQ